MKMGSQSMCDDIVLWTISSIDNIFVDNRLMSYVKNHADQHIWRNNVPNISHKILYRDSIDPQKKNILCIPFYELSIHYTDICWDILPVHKEYLEEHNFIIAYFYPREYVFPEQEYFTNLKSNKIFSINNSYGIQLDPYQININLFDIHYKFDGGIGNIKYNFEKYTTNNVFEEKKYKISALFGELVGRRHRYDIFCRLRDSNFLYNDDIIYTFFRKDSPDRLSLNNETLEDIYEVGKEWAVFDEIKNSALNIVFETDPERPYYTEKLLKPIIGGVPFVWQAHQGLKDVLSDMGYLHYPFIDYSFDSVEDPRMRTEALFKEVVRLYKLDLNSLSKEFEHISKHNQNNFWSRDSEKELYDALSKTF